MDMVDTDESYSTSDRVMWHTPPATLTLLHSLSADKRVAEIKRMVPSDSEGKGVSDEDLTTPFTSSSTLDASMDTSQ